MGVRLRRRVGVLCLALGLVGGGVACDAGIGASGGVRLTVPEVFYLRPPGDRAGRPGPVTLDVRVAGASAATDDDPTRHGSVTVDARGLESVVTLRKNGSRCTGGPAKVTCSTGPAGIWSNDNQVKPVAAEGSKVGDTGTIRYRLTTADGTVRTARTRVVVGEPVLEMRRPDRITGVAPGGTVTFPLVVRNTGEVAADGVAVAFDTSGMPHRQRYRNCRYAASHQGHTAVCSFPDLRIRPGEMVAFTPAPRFEAPQKQLSSSVRQSTWPLVLGPPADAGWPPDGAPGDGAALTARDITRPPAGPATFSARDVVWTDVDMAVHADFAAVGATVHGSRDSEQRISVGARNGGPGELGAGRTVTVEFTVPLGSLVVKQPTHRTDEDTYGPLCRHGFDADDRDVYTCEVDAMGAGRTHTLDFTLRLHDSGTGRVRVRSAAGVDGRSANDTARVTVTVAP